MNDDRNQDGTSEKLTESAKNNDRLIDVRYSRTSELGFFFTRFIKFTGVGAIGTVAHYVTLVFFVHLISLNAVFASSIGAVVGALVNYILNYYITFKSTKNHREAISKFFTIASIGFILNGLLMMLLTQNFSVHYFLAQVVTTAIILIWNFIGNHYWTFK